MQFLLLQLPKGTFEMFSLGTWREERYEGQQSSYLNNNGLAWQVCKAVSSLSVHMQFHQRPQRSLQYYTAVSFMQVANFSKIHCLKLSQHFIAISSLSLFSSVYAFWSPFCQDLYLIFYISQVPKVEMSPKLQHRYLTP